MKKVLYSGYTKAIALVLCVASVVSVSLTAARGIIDYFREGEGVYALEDDFSETRFFMPFLNAPADAIWNAYVYELGEELPQDWDRTLTPEMEKAVGDAIGQWLSQLYCKDKINYYVAWNDRVFTNCDADSPEDLENDRFSLCIRQDGQGEITRIYNQTVSQDYNPIAALSPYDSTSEIVVCTSIKEDYVTQCQGIWERQAALVQDTVFYGAINAAIGLVLLVYLIWVWGRKADGTAVSMGTDRVWAEVRLAALGASGVGGVAFCWALVEWNLAGRFPDNLTWLLVGLTTALAGFLILGCLLSLVSSGKNGQLLESSILFRLIRWFWRRLRKAAGWLVRKCRGGKAAILGALSHRLGILALAGLFCYTAAVGLCGVLGFRCGFFILLGVLLFVGAALGAAWRIRELAEVKKGVREVGSGNASYQIPALKSGDLQQLAHGINHIAQGLEASVAAKVKAERLKTELITNVSHDLKTPLTSIINYTQLLSQVEGLPEEAGDYAQIIAKKSQRLKTLTQDLFDISKAQSGNETVILEKIDTALLVQQALAEQDREIQTSGLTFCVNTPKELYIRADGRKMSRVLGNLLQNILKYAMKNTRVFLSACQEGQEVVMEFKNIASYPMDFQGEEIVGRFVRGDESRTAEGNGLGLAIAKSYTELCGGQLEIVVDGDLFKARLRFPTYQP